MADLVFLTGKSGRHYTYEAYQMDGPWTAEPGNYAFVRLFSRGILSMFDVFYVGQHEDGFKARMREHEKWPLAVALGATHVLAHVNRNALARLAEERDLIEAYDPPLNVQHRPTPLREVSADVPLGRRGSLSIGE